MQYRLFIFSTLLATLFFVLPTAVQGQSYKVTINGDGYYANESTFEMRAGALLNSNQSVVANPDSNFDPAVFEQNDVNQNVYNINLQPINAGAISDTNYQAAALVSVDTKGQHNLEALIDFTANLEKTAFGFLVYDLNNDQSFTGQILGGKDIEVINTGSMPDSNAIGLGFFAQNRTDPLAISDGNEINVGRITANSQSGDGFGFFSGGITDGSITLGGVNVTAQNVADGVHIEGQGINNTGSIVINGDLTVTSTAEEARGLSIDAREDDANNPGPIKANVIINGEVIVKGQAQKPSDGNGASAIGLQFAGDITGGSIEARDVTVTSSNGSAIGVDFQGTVDSGVTTDFGEIKVTAGLNGSAYGIIAQDTGSITLSKDITVKTTGGNAQESAFGVVFNNDGIVHIADNVNIKATYDNTPNRAYALYARNALTLDIDKDKTLTANRVGATTLNVSGNGRADFQYVDADSTNVSGNAVLAVDGTTMAEGNGYLGNVKMDGTASRLEIYGNITNYNYVLGGNFEGEDYQFVNMASLTNWVQDGNTIKAAGMRDKAFFNDNYLAATQIHQKYTGLHAVKDHVISGAVLTMPQYDYYGQSNNRQCKPRGAWVNYIGRNSHYGSSYNNADWDFISDGVQVGTDIIRTRRDQYGLFFGYEGTSGVNLADRLDANDYYVGVYGVHVFNNGADLRTVFNFGWQDFQSSRRAKLGSNIITPHKMSFEGNTAELNIELGKRRYFGNWSARPVVAIDWNLSQLDDAQEDGNLAGAMNYDGANISQLFFRFGTDLRYEWRCAALEAGLYYSHDMLGDSLRAGVSQIDGGNPSTLVGSKLGRSVLTMNLGGSWTMCNNMSVFGGYRAEVTPERRGDGYAHTGYVGGAWRW